ncbi:MAG: MerR family transcriptional regulator [Geminicoccaceae bacterium]
MASVMQNSSASNDRAAAGGRRTKSAGAFRTISEVADELDVAQHVLRFWESKFPQVRPLKRGGGRRYYRPEDVDLLRRIRSLLYEEGYTIKGAQKLLKSQRRTPTDRPSRDNGGAQAASPDEPPAQIAAPAHAPLDAQQKQALSTVRAELIQLRDSLRKFTS